jgi:hypothetical protein
MSGTPAQGVALGSAITGLWPFELVLANGPA